MGADLLYRLLCESFKMRAVLFLDVLVVVSVIFCFLKCDVSASRPGQHGMATGNKVRDRSNTRTSLSCSCDHY